MAHNKQKMTEQDIVTYISERSYSSPNYDGSEISETRQRLHRRYLGKYQGDVREGYSKFVSREIMQAVEWAMAPIMKAFVSRDKIVMFEPTGQEDDAQAEFETMVVNRMLLENEGFLTTYSFCKSALITPTAYAMLDVERKKSTLTRQVTGVTMEELPALMNDPAIKITKQDSEFIGDIEVFDLEYEETRERASLVYDSIPPENVTVDTDLQTTSLKDSSLVMVKMDSNYSELCELGYDKKILDEAIDAGTDADRFYNSERVERMLDLDQYEDLDEPIDASRRPMRLIKCWIYMDYDGDGVAELRQIDIANHRVVRNEGTDYCPVVAMSAVGVPHSHVGLCLAQLVEDLEELNTALYRQLLDSIYAANVNKTYVGMQAFIQDGTTETDLLNRQAEFVRVRGNPHENVLTPPPFTMTRDILPVITHTEDMASLRTGVAPQNSVDPGVIANAKSGAFMGAMEKSTERIELIVRFMAETGIKELMRKAHMLIRKNPDLMEEIKVGGDWRHVGAEDWTERRGLAVNVGLGFNNKEQVMGMLTQLLEIQERASQAGLAGAPEFHNTLQKLTDQLDIGVPSLYFQNPNSPDWQPPEPEKSPEMIVAEATAQKVQIDGQMNQQKMQLEMQKMQLEVQKMQMELQEAQMTSEMKMRELGLKEEEAGIKTAGLLADVEYKAAMTDKLEKETESTVSFEGSDIMATASVAKGNMPSGGSSNAKK